MSARENRIAAQIKRIAVLDDRIGRLMAKRVNEEDKLARLYGEQSPTQGRQG